METQGERKVYALAPTETDEDAKDRMKRTIAFEEKPENKYALFVYLKKTGEAIGFAGMRELERGIYEETGIALGPEFVQKGYGRQILRHFLRRRENWEQKEFHACNRTGNACVQSVTAVMWICIRFTVRRKDRSKNR